MNDRPGDPQTSRPSEEPELMLTIENAIEDRVRALRQLMQMKHDLPQTNGGSKRSG